MAEVARRLIEVAGSAEMVVRYGGEEFAIAVADRKLEALLGLAEAIRAAMEERAVNDASFGAIPLTVSCGVSVEALPDAQWERLVEQADAALYEAKASGRNRVRVTNGVIRQWGMGERAAEMELRQSSEDAA